MANKIGRNKKVCDSYRTSGRRSENKIAKQIRHEKRMAKFAKRREEGKSYEYSPNPFTKGTKEYIQEEKRRSEKNVNHKTPLQTMASIMKKLDNQLAKERMARKEHLDKKKTRTKTA